MEKRLVKEIEANGDVWFWVEELIDGYWTKRSQLFNKNEEKKAIQFYDKYPIAMAGKEILKQDKI